MCMIAKHFHFCLEMEKWGKETLHVHTFLKSIMEEKVCELQHPPRLSLSMQTVTY